MVLVILALSACARPAPGPGAAGPVEAAQELAAALQRGDGARAYALLSSKTRAEAERLARAAHPGPGSGPEAAQQMLFALLAPLPKPQPPEVRVLSEEGDSAQLQVTGPDKAPRDFHAVREGGLWRIDLPLSIPPGNPQPVVPQPP